MGKKVDLTGQVFERLTVIKEGSGYTSPNGRKAVTWICQCECGKIVEVISNALRRGNTKSCGCYSLSKKTKHGMYKTKEYNCWRSIKQRCLNPNSQNAAYYIERGITMCDEWRDSFEQFYKDMGPAPAKDYSLDRIDNDLGYFKENCRWVKDETGIQAINQRAKSNNTSGVTGVSWDKTHSLWVAYIQINRKFNRLGYFKNKEDAVAARKAAEEKYYEPKLEI